MEVAAAEGEKGEWEKGRNGAGEQSAEITIELLLNYY